MLKLCLKVSKVQFGDTSSFVRWGTTITRALFVCKLCLDAGNKKKGQVKYCGRTTNLVQHLKSWHNEDHKAVKEEEEKAKGKKESILHHFAARKSVEKWPKSHQRWKDLAK